MHRCDIMTILSGLSNDKSIIMMQYENEEHNSKTLEKDFKHW